MKNLVMFLVGFCAYITIETCFRGHSYPLMGILGGIALIMIDKINDHISWDMDLLLQGCIGSTIITAMELIVGEVAKHTEFLPAMWDYSQMPLNYDGVICLPFSLAWLALSIVAVFLADAINYYVFREEPVPRYRIFGWKWKFV